LRSDLRQLVERKAAVIEGWIADGRMAQVDARHLFFTIWAATQTYADFEAQVCAVLDVPELGAPGFSQASTHLKTLLLRGCGLA
jgi:TetR/AcrR family transcriptional regulator